MKRKCNICGKYETKPKSIPSKNFTILDGIEVSYFRIWKWCKVHNNWCRNIAGNCEQIVLEKKENKMGSDFKMIMEDEL